MADIIKELQERRRQEYSMRRLLQHYIECIASLEIDYKCETECAAREDLSNKIKQFDNCLKDLEKKLGIPKNILYTKFIDKRQVLISEYKSMRNECQLGLYSPQELLYSVRKRELIEKKLEALL